MDKGYIWVWLTIQTNREQNASNLVWQQECPGKLFCVDKRNKDGSHGTNFLPIQQMELPGVH